MVNTASLSVSVKNHTEAPLIEAYLQKETNAISASKTNKHHNHKTTISNTKRQEYYGGIIGNSENYNPKRTQSRNSTEWRHQSDYRADEHANEKLSQGIQLSN